MKEARGFYTCYCNAQVHSFDSPRLGDRGTRPGRPETVLGWSFGDEYLIRNERMWSGVQGIDVQCLGRGGGSSHADMMGMLVEIFKNNP